MTTITKLQKMLKLSMVNDKNNYPQQKCVEPKEVATRNQSSQVLSIIRNITRKSTTSSATNMNKRDGDPPANRDELVQEYKNTSTRENILKSF